MRDMPDEAWLGLFRVSCRGLKRHLALRARELGQQMLRWLLIDAHDAATTTLLRLRVGWAFVCSMMHHSAGQAQRTPSWDMAAWAYRVPWGSAPTCMPTVTHAPGPLSSRCQNCCKRVCVCRCFARRCPAGDARAADDRRVRSGWAVRDPRASAQGAGAGGRRADQPVNHPAAHGAAAQVQAQGGRAARAVGLQAQAQPSAAHIKWCLRRPPPPPAGFNVAHFCVFFPLRRRRSPAKSSATCGGRCGCPCC